MNNNFTTKTLDYKNIRNQALAEAGNHKNIIYPAIYKDFQNKFYATMGISNPASMSEFIKDKTLLVAENTESNKKISIFINGVGELRHCKEDSNKVLVLYKSLYDGHIAYVSSLDMFADSKVDYTDYLEVKQTYKFELVRY